MENLFTLLFFLFATLALLVFILGRFAKPMTDDRTASFSRWIIPLLFLLLVIQIIRHYFF
ncbi:MAG: hypothetical protein P8M71_01895 [Pseudomonadales bacterium]|nr:hypothetical protein [Pseudomonadales bacterium]